MGCSALARKTNRCGVCEGGGSESPAGGQHHVLKNHGVRIAAVWKEDGKGPAIQGKALRDVMSEDCFYLRLKPFSIRICLVKGFFTKT